MKRNGLIQGMAVVSALGVAAVTGCSQAVESTKAGGSTTPVTLRLGTNDNETAPSARAIETFADQVEELSGGELVIEPVWAANQDPEVADWDQRVARMVVSGDLDMGFIPARAWDTEGVASLRALSAPLLLTSQPLVDEVVRSDVAEDALAGLETAGVTGLALVPEGLRHVFSYGDPLVTPEAFAGTTIRTPRSETGYAVFRAWGADPDDLVGQAFDDGIFTGSVAGVDSSFARAGGLGSPTTVAANLTTSANVNTLVVQTEVLEGLTSAHADVLREAAIATRDAVLADPPDEAALAEDFCAAGGRVVTAGDADLAALEVSSRPVYAELERDPATKEMLGQIVQMKADVPSPTPIAPCGSTSGGATPSVQPADTEGAFPEGVYRMEISEAVFLAAGVTQVDARNHAGIWTLTFGGGEVVIEDVRTSDNRRSSIDGAYCVSGQRVSVVERQSGQCGSPVLFSATWQLDGRELRFTEVHDGATDAPTVFFDALWGSQVWTRID